MSKRRRSCYLCGTDYQYCPTCSQDRMKPTWMAEFHEENCVKIFEVCTRFNMQKMSKEEAKNALSSCDLSNKANFKSYVQRDLDVIFEEEPIVVTVDTEIKEVSKDKAIVETSIKGSKKKQQHEVVIIENE